MIDSIRKNYWIFMKKKLIENKWIYYHQSKKTSWSGFKALGNSGDSGYSE